MKTGLFGGTFDPIHLGHLIIAEDVREKLGLDRVIFIPARNPWLKADREISDGKHRLRMVKLAVASNPYFEMSAAEMERSGPSYTIDTVEAMKEEFGPGEELYFIAGSDAVADMPRWKDPERVMSLCRIVGVRRPGAAEIDVEALRPLIPAVSSCLRVIDVPQIDISSTVIRERIRAGLSIRYLVTDEVEEYIHEHKLYLL
jgi:nicotinate-nucleotide adenylyltransferase